MTGEQVRELAIKHSTFCLAGGDTDPTGEDAFDWDALAADLTAAIAGPAVQEERERIAGALEEWTRYIAKKIREGKL